MATHITPQPAGHGQLDMHGNDAQQLARSLGVTACVRVVLASVLLHCTHTRRDAEGHSHSHRMRVCGLLFSPAVLGAAATQKQS